MTEAEFTAEVIQGGRDEETARELINEWKELNAELEETGQEKIPLDFYLPEPYLDVFTLPKDRPQ